MAPRFLFGIGLVCFGILFSLSSTSYLGMWLGLEINLLGMVPLLATHSRELTSFRGVTYFCYQAVGRVLFLFGGILRAVLIVLGLLIKVGAAPVHGWVPVVISGTSWGNILLLLTVQKLAPLWLVRNRLGFLPMLTSLVLIAAGVSGLVGGLGGIRVSRLREIIAYSSILNMGWLLILRALRSHWVFANFIIIYFLITGLLITSVWGSEWDLPSPWLSWGCGIRLLSLAGLPPLIGFIPKLLVFLSVGTLLLLPLILGSLLALFYYLSAALSLVFGAKTRFVINSWPELRTSLRVLWNGLGGFLCLLLLLKN